MSDGESKRGPLQPDIFPSRDTVVLVHGLASSRTLLWPLERALQQRGFQTLNWGYSSIRGELQALSDALGARLRSVDTDPAVSRFHLVTHSMGSILARRTLTENDFERLGRVVMLGPPHGGSRVATHLARFLGWFCRPLKQLSHVPDSLVNSLPEPSGCEIGIIAASRDRVVRIEDTLLSSQADHIVVKSGHTRMLYQLQVADLIASFLRDGRFARQQLRMVAKDGTSGHQVEPAEATAPEVGVEPRL